MGDEVGDFRRNDLLRVSGPEARLDHRMSAHCHTVSWSLKTKNPDFVRT